MRKITKLSTKAKAVAGSALFLGATIVGGAAMAAAQDGSSGNLGDYPAPFVDDGEVDTNIIVGDDAATIDVVGAVDIAGALSQQAFTEEEQTVTVEGVPGWSAANGLTLNRANQHLFLDDATDAGESRLDDRDAEILESTEFTSEDGESVDVDFEVEIQSNSQVFDAGAGDLDDPALYVAMPNRGSVDTDGNSLFEATIEFSETVNFDETEDGNDYVALEDGDEIELFGQTYTFSDESGTDELILYGDSETFTAEYREPETFTVDGNEHTVEVRYVGDDGDSATIRVDGDTESVDDGDTIRLSGQDVRVRDIFRTGPDGEGDIVFGIGSEELSIQDDRVELDGDRVRGVDVDLDSGGDFTDVDGITIAFGGEGTDDDLVEAGDSYVDTVFGQLEFHYGGLNADAADEYAEAFEVEAEEDDGATFTTTSDAGEEAEIQIADDEGNLGHDDGAIATYEGEWLTEDDYVVLNENERAGVYEITTVIAEELNSGANDDSLVELELENIHTGETVEIEEEDFSASGYEHELENERIEGMRFDVTFGDDEDGEFDDDSVRFVRERAEDDEVQVFANWYTESDAGAAIAGPDADVAAAHDIEDDAGDTIDDKTIVLPSALDTDAEATITFSEDTNDDVSATGDGWSVQLDDSTSGTTEDSAVNTIGQIEYELTAESDQNGNLNSLELSVTEQDGSTALTNPAAVYVHPEDDNDEEHAFILEVESAETDGNVNVYETEGTWEQVELDSEDGVHHGYALYGTFTQYDDDDSDEEWFRAQVPSAQSTSGMAFTGPDGSLSADAGATDQTVTSQIASGWPESGLLDSDVGSAERNENMVLVGGPAVNTLVQELADEDKTQEAADYDEGQAIIQHIPDAISEGNDALVVAGHSGQDTRNAASALVNMNLEAGTILGESVDGVGQVTIDTAQNNVVSTE